MKARCAAGIVALATAGALAWATYAQAEDPAPTVTVVQTQTVHDTEQGKSPKWWAARSRAWHRRYSQADRDARARARVVRSLRRANHARLELGGTGLERAFLCIHSFEGSWTDPNAPYYGGVQMDRDFMRAYGGPFYRAWGTADHWPAAVQVVVAEAAYLSGRGWGPWPNTSRMCGL